MSYILDALKKSEAQRNRLQQPEQLPFTQHAANGRRRFALPAVLFIVALLLGWESAHLISTPPTAPAHPKPAPSPASATQAEQHIQPMSPAPKSPPTTATQPRSAEKAKPIVNNKADHQPAARSTPAQKTPTLQTDAKQQEQPVPLFEPVTAASPISRAGSELPDLPVDDSTEPSDAEQNIPARHDLPMAIQRALPKIDIEGHIYDENPASRMVIINGRVSHEKQPINGNLSLEEITPDGVILNYQGHVFHMGVFDR